MLTRLFRHMSTIGHAFGVEGIKLRIIVEIHGLDALASADLDECEVEIEVLIVICALLRLFFLSHRVRNDKS